MWLFYRLFGVNEDVAAMVNVIYIAVLLIATWSIAERVSNRPTAALAVTVLGTFPIIFIMSRLSLSGFCADGAGGASTGLAAGHATLYTAHALALVWHRAGDCDVNQVDSGSLSGDSAPLYTVAQ